MLTGRDLVSIATIADYLHVQLTSPGPLPSVLPPVHVAVLPSGQVTEHDWVLSALLAEHVLRSAALAKFALRLAMAIVDAISSNARIRFPPL